jgi:CheY-like chemotaxis protein
VAARGSAQRAVHATLAGRTVLVIEDNPDSRDLLVSILQSLRAHVLVAANIEEAERIFIFSRVHLIVCDMKLPDGTGLDFVRWVRLQRPPMSRTPCVAITGYDRYFPAEKAVGFDAYMRKPINIDKFCDVAVALGGG